MDWFLGKTQTVVPASVLGTRLLCKFSLPNQSYTKSTPCTQQSQASVSRGEVQRCAERLAKRLQDKTR